jgi:predicted XRE-type DNA-binding protein
MKTGVRRRKTKSGLEYEISSGNVFADLGLPNPEELLAKAELAHRIHVLIKQRNLTQRKAAELLGIDQPKVSALIRGRLEGFSTERLFRFLNLLDQHVEIIIRPKRRAKDQARIQVKAG